MNLGLVTVRGPDYHPNRRLLEAAARRGHHPRLIHPYRSWPAVIGNTPDFCGEPVSVDLLLPRQGAEIGESSLTFIEQVEMAGTTVVNGAAAIRLAASKYRTARTLSAAGAPVPEAVLINTPEAVASAAAAVGGFPAVVKPVSGRQGQGVFLAVDADSLHGYLAGAGDLKAGVVVQRFIPPAGRRDLRILVLGQHVAGASALRPADGDFRSNFHLTGSAEPVEPEAAIASLAVSAVRALGLQIAGVDMAIDDRGRPWLMEVNYAPGFRGLEAATGLDIAGAMVEYLERCWTLRA
jgi:ribosomal protein S6--L-glutamate ligase